MQEWSYLSYPHLSHLEKVEKSDGFWKMSMCFHKPNSVVTLITDLVPDVVSFRKYCIFMQHRLWPWSAAFDPWCFFFVPSLQGPSEAVCFCPSGPTGPLHCLASGLYHFCCFHMLVQGDLDHLGVP